MISYNPSHRNETQSNSMASAAVLPRFIQPLSVNPCDTLFSLIASSHVDCGPLSILPCDDAPCNDETCEDVSCGLLKELAGCKLSTAPHTILCRFQSSLWHFSPALYQFVFFSSSPHRNRRSTDKGSTSSLSTVDRCNSGRQEWAWSPRPSL